jgi:hypothetical protein
MARATVSRAERIKLGREIRIGLQNDRTIPSRTRKFADEVAAYWKNVAWPTAIGTPPAVSGPGHFYETGTYRDSIHVERKRKRFGMPHYAVVSNDPNANFIEFGTGPDKPGSRSPWGPYTPTPEFAPAGKTAFHFGGTAP